MLITTVQAAVMLYERRLSELQVCTAALHQTLGAALHMCLSDAESPLQYEHLVSCYLLTAIVLPCMHNAVCVHRPRNCSGRSLKHSCRSTLHALCTLPQ